MGSRYLTTSGELLDYLFSPQAPTEDGQVLTSLDGAAVWGTGGGGSSTIVGTAGQVAVTTAGDETTIALAATYQIPPTLGTAGQVLAAPTTGTMLDWATIGGGGSGVLEGTTNEIAVTTVGDASQIALDPTHVIIPALFTVGGVTYPSVEGTTGEVLTLTSSTTAAWASGGGGGGGDVVGTLNEIVVDNLTTPGTSILSLANDTHIGGVAMPPKTSTPSVGQVLTVNTTTSAEWSSLAAGTTTISGTANEITVATVGDAATISLPAAITAPGSLTVVGALDALTLSQDSLAAYGSTGPMSLDITFGDAFVGSVQCVISKIFNTVFMSVDWSTLANVTGTPVISVGDVRYFKTDYTGVESFLNSEDLPALANTSWAGQSVYAGSCTMEVWPVATPGVGDPTANTQANFSIIPGTTSGQVAMQIYLSDNSSWTNGFDSDYAFRFMGESASGAVDVPTVLQLIWH